MHVILFISFPGNGKKTLTKYMVEDLIKNRQTSIVIDHTSLELYLHMIEAMIKSSTQPDYMILGKNHHNHYTLFPVLHLLDSYHVSYTIFNLVPVNPSDPEYIHTLADRIIKRYNTDDTSHTDFCDIYSEIEKMLYKMFVKTYEFPTPESCYTRLDYKETPTSLTQKIMSYIRT